MKIKNHQKNDSQLPDEHIQDIDKIIEDVAMWKNENALNGYYSSIADSIGYIPSRSAKEILKELGLDDEKEQKNKKVKQKKKGNE